MEPFRRGGPNPAVCHCLREQTRVSAAGSASGFPASPVCLCPFICCARPLPSSLAASERTEWGNQPSSARKGTKSLEKRRSLGPGAFAVSVCRSSREALLLGSPFSLAPLRRVLGCARSRAEHVREGGELNWEPAVPPSAGGSADWCQGSRKPATRRRREGVLPPLTCAERFWYK